MRATACCGRQSDVCGVDAWVAGLVPSALIVEGGRNCMMNRVVGLLIGCALVVTARAGLAAPQIDLRLPLRRTAYQTNEKLALAVVRSDTNAPLSAVDLALEVRGDDDSLIRVLLPLPAVPADAQGRAIATTHLGLDARLLRPGSYVLSVTAHAVTATQRIDVCSHIRKTPFRLIDWGGSGNGPEQILAGENGTGINLQYASWNGFDQDANIRGGMDFMRNCAMGGAHQMDGRQECDWSDPHVLLGGNARVARQALLDRTAPNVIGVHFYDEPGLTWRPHPVTGVFSLNNIPSQDWAFKAAFGTDAMQYTAVKTNDVATVAAWESWLRWKQVFMEAAWRQAAFALSYVDPAMIGATQSMYAWYAFGDGYYANIARPLPVMSGHGGYDDLAGGFLCPGFFFEFGRARDFNKPVWYLPQWWSAIPSPVYRLEQYLTFMMGPQGLMIPPASRCEAPGMQPQSDGLLESNRLMARLGPIFTEMPPTRPEVAVLYAMSQNTQAMVESPDMLLAQDFPGQVERLLLLYTAAKMAHIPIFPVVEEDVLDGTVAANHRALILTGISRLDPKIVGALEAWIVAGGQVILGDECTVPIAGALRLGATVHDHIYREFKTFMEDPNVDPRLRREQALARRSPLAYYREAQPIADALAARCEAIGIRPLVACDAPDVFASRHAFGDIEYLFLVNAATEAAGVTDGRWNSVCARAARVSLPDDGRPIYDAVVGGATAEFGQDGAARSAALRFGPGQMRVFARTARPLGPPHISTPLVSAANYAASGAVRPLTIRVSVADAAGAPLQAVLPMRIRVTDPLGVTRYDLYRASAGGELRLELPLAVNDPPGTWSVRVDDLVSGLGSTAAFDYQPPAQAGAVAGLVPRAVCLAADREPIFRFFRLHRTIALIPGANPWELAAAERLAADLKRWGVTASIVAAADIVRKERPRDQWPTWSGARGHPDYDMPAEAAVLLGSAAQHPLIQTMLPGRQTPAHLLLPYLPVPGVFPGVGRGLIAWQTDAVGFGNYETITLIADDAVGMAEAVGTLFELLSGYRPATDWELPGLATVTPAAQRAAPVPLPREVGEMRLADRAVALQALSGGDCVVLSQDGNLTRRQGDGTVRWTATVEPVSDGTLRLAANMQGSLIAVATARVLVTLDGEGRELFRYPLRFPSELLKMPRVDSATCLAVAPDGSRVAAGTADGRLVLLDREGRSIRVSGGVTPEEHAAWQAAQKEWNAGKGARERAKREFEAAKAAYDKAAQAWNAQPKAERGPAPKAPPKPPKAPPTPKYPGRETVRSLSFSADSRSLLALSDARGVLFNAVDGQELGTVEGVGGTAAPQAAGNRFLAPGRAADSVCLVAATDGSPLGEVRLGQASDAGQGPARGARKDAPRDRIVAVRALPDGLLVARAQEGSVRRCRSDGREVWIDRIPAVIKRMEVGGDCVAIAYWGGRVRILDLTTGRVRAAQTCETDVAEIAWLGNELCVALADGRLLRVAVP